jgi:hypothetical protein
MCFGQADFSRATPEAWGPGNTVVVTIFQRVFGGIIFSPTGEEACELSLGVDCSKDLFFLGGLTLLHGYTGLWMETVELE